MVEIKTERLVLRPLGIQYLESVHEYASDLNNTRYMMFLPNDTVEETKEFLEGVDKQWASDNQTCYEFAILLKGKMIGAVSLNLEEEDLKSGELGWIVNKKYWGQGIAPEAAAALVEYAKEKLGVTHFIAHCDAGNPGSYRTMEKIGMVRTAEYGGRFNKSSDEERQEYQYEMNV